MDITLETLTKFPFHHKGKQSVIISDKHGIYELPPELPNDLKLKKLGKIRRISKLQRT